MIKRRVKEMGELNPKYSVQGLRNELGGICHYPPFPEIFEDQITEDFNGTARWIFGTNYPVTPDTLVDEAIKSIHEYLTVAFHDGFITREDAVIYIETLMCLRNMGLISYREMANILEEMILSYKECECNVR